MGKISLDNPLLKIALRDGVAEPDGKGGFRLTDDYWNAVFTEMLSSPGKSMMEITKRAVARTKKVEDHD